MEVSNNEEIFHLLVNQIQEYAIYLIDPNGMIASWNAGAGHIKGYSAAEVIGKPMDIFYTKEDVTKGIPAKSLQLARELGHYEDEGWRVKKDGTRFWANVVFTPLWDDCNNLKGYAKVTRDNTGRYDYQKSIEEKLEKRNREIIQNERRFRALLENNFDIISLLDSSFKIIYRSPSAERATGWTNEELISGDSQRNIHPDDLHIAHQVFSDLMIYPGRPIPSLFRNKHKNGTYRWLEGVSTNLLHADDVQAIIFNFRDITERKISEEKIIQSEKLYRSLFENILHGFAFCKCVMVNGLMTDFTYLVVNEKYIELTGLKKIVGMRASQALPFLLDPNKPFFQKISAVALSGKPECFEAYLEGPGKWLAVSIYSPEPEHFVALLDDISQSKIAEQKIHSINAELERKVLIRTDELKRKNEEMEAFSYSVSHDLRAPLRGIIGFTTILEKEYGSSMDDEGKRITAVIKKNTVRMGNLIDDLLAFSRSGKNEIVQRLIETDQLVHDIKADLERDNGSCRIAWCIEPLISVYGDLGLIRQVWINLISNAVKYSAGRENPAIHISSEWRDGQVIFAIQDNGVGFNMKYVNKLFKVFQRLHGANEFEGTGIGLAIVEKIINRHGGKIWVEAEMNKGASFYFSLPAGDN